jgi:hypothetical protein
MEGAHVHTDTPPLTAPWCPGCSALLDKAIQDKDEDTAALWTMYNALFPILEEPL